MNSTSWKLTYSPQVQYPRLSYLPFLLPRLHCFFSSALINPDVAAHQGWFSFGGVPLKWQHPVGLMYDLFSGAEFASVDISASRKIKGHGSNEEQRDGPNVLPWKIVLHFTHWPSDHLIPLDSSGKIHHDVFINSVKEADFLRNGTAKVIMSLSKDDSTKLWQSVQDHNLALFNTVNQKFLNPPGGAPLRHGPMKIHLPTNSDAAQTAETGGQSTRRVVQSLVAPMLSTRDPQTLGTALHSLLPTVFPSKRSALHAKAVLHGATVPLVAHVQELVEGAAYPDGFLHIAIVLVS